MGYTDILLMGSGSLMINCLKWILSQGRYNLKCIESEKRIFSNLQTVCNTNGIPYSLLTEKEDIQEYFSRISDRTLVLSIHNSYIFNRKVLESKDIKIINFHNSLLPKHPGRNAPSWAIYDLDSHAGITWHEVVTAVDKGAIICQKSFLLDPDITGIQLTYACVKLGFEFFKEFFTSFAENTYSTVPQIEDGPVKMHYSYEVPNDGIFNTGWSPKKMSAFLRCLDYGAYPIFPKPKLFYQNNWFTIEKYELFFDPSQKGNLILTNDDEVIFTDDEVAVKLHIKPPLT